MTHHNNAQFDLFVCKDFASETTTEMPKISEIKIITFKFQKNISKHFELGAHSLAVYNIIILHLISRQGILQKYSTTGMKVPSKR